jgi:hypothetical protein
MQQQPRTTKGRLKVALGARMLIRQGAAKGMLVVVVVVVVVVHAGVLPCSPAASVAFIHSAAVAPAPAAAAAAASSLPSSAVVSSKSRL